MKELPAQPNQSVASALECLLHIGTAGRPVGSREMARELGMEHTKANRMLGTLAGLGLAEKTPERKYVPGPGIHVLAAMSLSGSNLLAAALEPIQKLRRETGMLVALGVLWRDHVCYLFHGAPNKPITASVSGHGLYPANRSSIGMILLSGLSTSEARARFPEEAPPFFKELKSFATQGYALIHPKDQSMAVGIANPHIAGLAVSGRITKANKSSLLRQLRKTAGQIETNMNTEVEA